MVSICNVICAWQETLEYEKSELLLYENMLLVESGRHQAALDHLQKFEDQIVDRVSYLEVKGSVIQQQSH